MTKAEAVAISGGGLTRVSKMPCMTYNIACHGKCSYCYAKHGRFRMPDALVGLERRYEAVSHPLWTEAMVELVGRTRSDWFRWHSCGELIDADHLAKVIEIAHLLPRKKFWLPTMRGQLFWDYWAEGYNLPPNLTVRLSFPPLPSAPVGGEVAAAKRVGILISLIDDGTRDLVGKQCPATYNPDRHNCLSCRACWDKKVPVVIYKLH